MNNKNSLLSIQYLRGIAALLVVVTHILMKLEQLGYPHLDSFWFNGGIGIDLFFIISGYVMCLTTQNNRTRDFHLTIQFITRRAIRIFPMYWALTTLALFIYLIAPSQINAGGGETRVLESFLLLPTEGKYLVKNGWTLTYELYFYIVFAISLLLNRAWSIPFLILFISTPVIIGYNIDIDNPWLIVLCNNLTLEFLMGVLLFYIHKSAKFIANSSSAIFGLLLILGSITYLIKIEFSYETTTRFLDFGIPSLAICWGFLFLEPTLQKYRLPALQMIGDSSYSLYLIHPFVLAALRGLYKNFELSNSPTLLFVVSTMLFMSILAGYVSYVLFEDVATKYFKKSPFSEYLIFRWKERCRLLIQTSARGQ